MSISAIALRISERDIAAGLAASPMPRYPIPLPALEALAAEVIAGVRDAPVDPRTVEDAELAVEVGLSRDLAWAPRVFWSTQVRQLLASNPGLTTREVAAAGWDWFATMTSSGPSASVHAWRTWIRRWARALARVARTHVLIGCVIGPGDLGRVHSHMLVSFPPGGDKPDESKARAAWRDLSVSAGRVELGRYDPAKGGLLYLLRHARTAGLLASRFLAVGCPERRSCVKRGCRFSCAAWPAPGRELLF